MVDPIYYDGKDYEHSKLLEYFKENGKAPDGSKFDLTKIQPSSCIVKKICRKAHRKFQ